MEVSRILFQFSKNLIESKWFSNIVLILLTAIFTGFFAKRNLYSSTKIKNEEKQLLLVIQPLYATLSTFKNVPSYHENPCRKLFEIIEEHPLLVSDEILSLILAFQSALKSDIDVKQFFELLCASVTYQYETLRRKLGYPGKKFPLFRYIKLLIQCRTYTLELKSIFLLDSANVTALLFLLLAFLGKPFFFLNNTLLIVFAVLLLFFFSVWIVLTICYFLVEVKRYRKPLPREMQDCDTKEKR